MLAQTTPDKIRVFYLWDFGVVPRRDPGFQREFSWDIDLLEGYESVFLKNEARDAGPHRFFGLQNPDLVSQMVDWKPDAILLFGYRSWSHVRLIFSRRLRHVPLIFRGDSHLLVECGSAARQILKRQVLRVLFRRFHACLHVGRANREYFRKMGASEDALFRAPHAVDQQCFHPDENGAERSRQYSAWGIPEGHRVLLFAGKLERKKRPDDLLAAFVSARLVNVTLVFVGNGPLEDSLRKLAAGHPHIRFVPFQNQSQMPGVYAAADLLCLPSQGPGESWGLAVQEAMACGVPPLVSDEVGCHLDLIRHGWNGLVFPAGNRPALAKALAQAFADPERLRLWGRNGLKLLKDFTYRETTAGLHRALDFISTNKRVPPESPPARIQLWVPDFFGTGGIQHYSRMLGRGLSELFPATTIPVLSKADSVGSVPSRSRTLVYAALLVWKAVIHRPNLVILTHLHFAPLAFWLKRILGLRYWVAVHGFEVTRPLSRRILTALHHADQVLPVSRHTRELVLKAGVESCRCTLLSNCVDGTQFYPGSKPEHLLRLYGLGPQSKILFTLARLDSRERYKGHDLLLEALPRILQLVPEAHYVLAGSGSDSARLRARIGELGLENNVTMTGFLPEHALLDHYHLCDLFVMPSRGEGFGIVFLEALACGRAVIAGKDDGSRDPLADGEFGKLIDPSNPDELIDAVVKSLLQHFADQEGNLTARRHLMLERFGFDAFKQRLAELVQS